MSSRDADAPALLRPELATSYLLTHWGIVRAVSTLAKLRVLGGGPKFHKLRRQVLYRPDELDRWAREQLGEAMPSTSTARAST